MGVEKKKRKRNLPIEADQDTSKKPRKNDTSEQEVDTLDTTLLNEVITNDSGLEPEPGDSKIPKDFKIANFRTKLRGSDFISELRQFLKLASTKPKIISNYIQQRGKPLELAEALERVDKSNIIHVYYICEALQLVIMEILTNHKNLIEPAMYACRFFLKSHNRVVESLLKSSNLSHRKCALKLLTAFVCVEPQLGRQVLSCSDVLSNVKTIENSLSQSKLELKESETVRKLYIHFVLAYLIDGNTLLIKNILDKGFLIKALASGLLFDDHVTVCMVLSTFKQYVLECRDISKTKKLHTFDADCVKSFCRLYDWLGPAALVVKLTKKDQKDLAFHNLKKFAKPEERELVADAVHQFLLTLLTSRKYGICFDAVTNFPRKNNILQGKVTSFIDRPWLCEKKTELVLRILRDCPDIALQTVKHFAHWLNPLKTPVQFWPTVCEFIAKVIDECHSSLLKGALKKITLTDYAYWIKGVCFPIEALTHLTGLKALKHQQFRQRVATNRLLLSMFRQYTNYIAVLAEREQQKHSDLRKFKFDILNHILLNFPTVENILYSLYVTIQDQEKDDVDVLEHLDLTLDLLLIICDHNRSFVNKTTTIMDYLKMLRPLYASDDGVGNLRLELKAVRCVLLLFPKALDPQQELFGSVLRSFIKGFVRGDVDIQREAGELLREIFLKTGIFDTRELEIDLWLEALRFVQPNTIEMVTEVFIEVLQVTNVEISAEDMSAQAPIERENLLKLLKDIEDGLSIPGYMETLTMSKLYPLILKGVEINKDLQKYMDLVNMLIQHYLNNMLIGETSLRSDPEVGKVIPYLRKLNDSIFAGEKGFQEIFASSSGKDQFSLQLTEGIQINLEKLLQNDRLVTIYLQCTMFTISHLLRLKTLGETQFTVAVDCMVNLLKVLRAVATPGKTALISLDENMYHNPLSYFETVVKYIYSIWVALIPTTSIFNGESCTLNFLKIIQQVTECINTFDLTSFSDSKANFCQKVVKSIEAAVKEHDRIRKQTDQLQPVVRLIEALQLSPDNCLEVLDHLSTLSCKDFAMKTGRKTVFQDIVIVILTRIANLQKSLKCDAFVTRFFQNYIKLLTKFDEETTLEDLETALHKFLLVCHQYIPYIPHEVFLTIFQRQKQSKATVRLACLLLDRNIELSEVFIKALPENYLKRELVYPLLNTALTIGIQLDESLLKSVYQEYKNGFMKTVEKPQKAGAIYKENVHTSIHLIEAIMPKSECIDFCNKHLKFDSVAIFQVKLVEAIFHKALKSAEESNDQLLLSKIFTQFLNVMLQMLAIVLKKEPVDLANVKLIGFMLFSWFNTHQQPIDLSDTLKSHNWMNFCKAALKSSMCSPLQDEDQVVVDNQSGEILKVLTLLCSRLYETSNENDETAQEAGQLFQLIFNHSQFYSIVLQINSTPVKTQIMHLLYILANYCPSVLEERQIPVILGAYQAKLTNCDRCTLALLQLYEKANIGLYKYRPFIWGESAIAFYSLRADQQEHQNLEYQETSVAQVMSLIDWHTCDHTIQNFPIWRKLDPSSQLPKVQFDNPDESSLSPCATNALEKSIELGVTSFEDVELRLCPRRDGFYDRCYDPAFIIPLMSVCFAPGTYSHPVRPVQNGMLSIVFAALSSLDKDMRKAAGCVQLRYRLHFENSKFFEKPLWVQAYDNIQNGLDALRADWQRHKKNSGIPRVHYISGHFLAKTINLMTDPTHVLYKQLTMFLRLKNTFNFLCVPEFNVLFHSPEIEHHTFRNFIVEVIRNGIKHSSDLFLLVTSNTLKALLGFYGSTMSTLDINLLILSIMSVCAKIPGSSNIMVENIGIIPWLTTVLNKVEFYQFDIIEGIISILNNLWYSIMANSKQLRNLDSIQSQLYRLILRLLPKLSGRISANNFAKLMNILNKTVIDDHMLRILSDLQLDWLIGSAQKIYEAELFNSIVSIKENGAEGAESSKAFYRGLTALNLDASTTLAVYSLREVTIRWARVHKEKRAD